MFTLMELRCICHPLTPKYLIKMDIWNVTLFVFLPKASQTVIYLKFKGKKNKIQKIMEK